MPTLLVLMESSSRAVPHQRVGLHVTLDSEQHTYRTWCSSVFECEINETRDNHERDSENSCASQTLTRMLRKLEHHRSNTGTLRMMRPRN